MEVLERALALEAAGAQGAPPRARRARRAAAAAPRSRRRAAPSPRAPPATPTAAASARSARRSPRTSERADGHRGRPGARARHERHLAGDAAGVLAAGRAGRRGAARRAPLSLLPELRPALRRARRSPCRCDPEDGFAAATPSACAPRGRRARARWSSPRPRTRRARCRICASLARSPRSALPLVSDEIYDGLVYDGARAPSALETGAPDVFVLDGFSKRYAMTGFRLGYAIAPAPEPRARAPDPAQNLFISASEFVQRAGIAALARGRADARARCASATRASARRMLEGLARIGLRVHAPPAGAFYVLADARHVDRDSRRLAFRLLEEAHVAVTPGVDFGAAARGLPALLLRGLGRDPRRGARAPRRARSLAPMKAAVRRARSRRRRDPRASRAPASPRSRSSAARTSGSRAC